MSREPSMPGWSASSPAVLPERPYEAPPPDVPTEPAPPIPPKRGGPWFLAVLLGLLAGAGAWLWISTSRPTARGAATGATVRTAVAQPGVVRKSLRVTGVVAAQNFAAIQAPRLRGPRDMGREGLTLTELAAPGSFIRAGSVVASFELQALEDHLSDVESEWVQLKSDIDKQIAENMVTRETDRQAMRMAQAESAKAALDLRTAEVRSEIEAEILKQVANEARVTAEQLEQETALKENVHAATENIARLMADEGELHLERHQRDYERMSLTTPLSGLVVVEPIYKGGGQFQQTEEGDQVYPGALFMRVVDLSAMIVSAAVNQVDIQSIRMGQRAEIHFDAYPNLTLEGRVVGIGAIAEAGGGGGMRFSRPSSGLYVKTVPVDIAIEGADERIIPDLSASAEIILSEDEAPVVAPREALRTSPEGESFVWVRRGQGFERQGVEVGSANAVEAAVEQGLEPGDELLLSERPPV